MIPALALAVPLLRGAGSRCAARSERNLVTRSRSLSRPGIFLGAAPELPANDAYSNVSERDGTRTVKTSASHLDLRLVGQRFQADPDEASNGEPDPEVRGIEATLRRIEQDPHARQQFYAEVDSLVRRVRSGQPIPQSLMLDSQLPLPLHRPAGLSETLVASNLPLPRLREQSITAPAPTTSAPPLRAPGFRIASPNVASSQPLNPRLLSPKSTPLNPAVVSRVVYWAQVNGCPTELALAVAWQESGMNLHPARGSSGEIGIMQIMPERARLEGVDPARLTDPETNLRLGTMLLARYYSEEGSVARAAMKYVAGPGVFGKRYAPEVRDYISWYSSSVDNNARYFGQYLNF
jgi:hypothetical protein